MPISRRNFAASLAALPVLRSPLARAQSDKYPSKVIKLIVPYAAGGGADAGARMLATSMTEGLGGPVIVENKPGANSIIGTTFVAKAPADGYTLLYGPVGTITVNPAVYPDLPYNSLRDFAPISTIRETSMVLVVPANSPAKTLKELIAHLQTNPATANYATSATPFQLMAELFALRSNLKLVGVPYKGTGESVNAIAAGQVAFSFVDITPVMSLIKGGRIRVLAVTGETRHQAFPDAPTLMESGIIDRPIALWGGIFAPAGTPAPIIQRLHKEIERYAVNPATKTQLDPFGVEASHSTPQALRKLVEDDIKLWTEVAAKANIRLTR